MKRLFQISTLVVLSLLLIPASQVFAKAPADLITISGPGLAKPIEITDPAMLLKFSPWDDNFCDCSRAAKAPPNADHAYQVQLQVKDEQGQFRWIYTFRYVPDASGTGGYINFPGPSEPELQNQNMFVIIRSYAGPWVYASDEWDSVARRVLKEHGVSTAPSPLLPLGELFAPSALIIAVSAVLVVTAFTLLWRVCSMPSGILRSE